MSLSIQFSGAPDGDDGPFSLASASGWSAFAAWADSLPAEFSALKKLADEGEYTGTDELSRQLSKALEQSLPKPLVADTARGLSENMGVGDSEETATVTDD